LNIISHRGYWKKQSEQNTIRAFEKSLSLGFGIETDVRDYKGELVIAHDIPNEECVLLEDFFSLYKLYKVINLPIALNIKSDGLQNKLKKLLEVYEVRNYFVFDMSVPDGIFYIKNDLVTFTRESEYETYPAFYDYAHGVWIDQFFSDWIDKQTIINHINNNKKICIVSPELHQRKYLDFWRKLKSIIEDLDSSQIMLCTDHPEEARIFFND
jgi:hypothetical protein